MSLKDKITNHDQVFVEVFPLVKHISCIVFDVMRLCQTSILRDTCNFSSEQMYNIFDEISPLHRNLATLIPMFYI